MKRIVTSFSAVVLATCAFAAFAQTYPAKAVRVVIPWPPGGSNDVVGRIVMQKMSELLGQQIERGVGLLDTGAQMLACLPQDLRVIERQ